MSSAQPPPSQRSARPRPGRREPHGAHGLQCVAGGGRKRSRIATVTPRTPGVTEPSGSVEYLDGGQPIAGCSSLALTAFASSSIATCQVRYGEVGSHSVTATSTGDASYFGSSSSALGVTVHENAGNGSPNGPGGGGTADGGGTTAGAQAGHHATSVRPLTRAQKLAKALTACKRLKKSKRKACEAQAKRRFKPGHRRKVASRRR